MNLFRITLNSLFSLFLLALLPLAAEAQQNLTLQDAITLAIEHNRNLKITDLDVSRTQQQARVSRSKLLPVVNLNGQYAHYFQRPVFFGLGAPAAGSEELSYARIGGEDQFVAAVSLVQPLYNPSLKPELQRARLLENTSRLAHQDRESEVVAQVKQTYLSILVLEQRLKLQHESLIRNQKVLNDAKSLYAQGRALRVDTLRAYTTVKNLSPDILKLSNAIANTRLQLINLLGAESTEEVALSDSLFIQTMDEIPSEENVVEEAKKSRPDLQMLSLNERIAEQQVSLARAGKLPSLSLVGQYQVLSQTNNFSVDQSSWPSVSFVGAQIAVPLFSGNSNSAKVKDAKFASEQSLLQHTDAVEQLKIQAHQVIASLHETTDRLQTQSTVKETAQLSYSISQYRYEKGVASRLELTDAELALTSAQLNYLEAVYDYLSAHIQLDRVLGKTVR